MTMFHKALTAALALTLAATVTSATSFAKDRKGLKTGSFHFVAPKADRGGDGGTATAKFLPPKSGRDNGGSIPVFRLTPKSNPAGSGPITTQFVAPKSDRGNAGNSGGPKIVEFVPPKSERGNSGSGVTTAKIVVPKAPRGDEPVLASAEQPAKPLLLAPASTSTETVADQGAPAPAASAIQAEAPSTGIVLPASSNEVALAYYRAAERYGYGSYSYASDDYGSDDDYSYEDQSYGYGSYDEDCQ